jgi:hypothetical protein
VRRYPRERRLSRRETIIPLELGLAFAPKPISGTSMSTFPTVDAWCRC